MNVVVLHQSQSTIVYILFLDCTNQGVGDSLNSSLFFGCTTTTSSI